MGTYACADSFFGRAIGLIHGRALKSKLDVDQPHGWWSQTGSNRRPPACKAGALPTELWPLTGRGLEGWWAWEDLNFRPHAYQARALTN
jgi:hypothetical protein